MYLSIRDDIVFAAGYSTLAAGLRDLKLDAVELFVKRDGTVPAITPRDGVDRLALTDPVDVDELAVQAKSGKVKIAALCMGNNFNAEDRAGEIAWAINTVRAAKTLGAPVVRIDAIMQGERHLPIEERQKIVAGCISEILAATVETGVDLGIENHGYQGNDPEFLTGLLLAVNSPRLGLTLDSGNFYWRGWPLARVYEIFEQFAPVVKHTHVKNIAYPKEIQGVQREMGYEYGKYVSPIHQGDIDHARYIAILRKAGYDRDICLEDESFGRFTIDQRRANLRAAAEILRASLA